MNGTANREEQSIAKQRKNCYKMIPPMAKRQRAKVMSYIGTSQLMQTPSSSMDSLDTLGQSVSVIDNSDRRRNTDSPVPRHKESRRYSGMYIFSYF